MHELHMHSTLETSEGRDVHVKYPQHIIYVYFDAQLRELGQSIKDLLRLASQLSSCTCTVHRANDPRLLDRFTHHTDVHLHVHLDVP